jgi:hypothetical protein
MSKPKLKRLSRERDGTSQIGRRLPALDPGYVSVDERGTAQLLEFARAYARQLIFYDEHNRPAGDWSALFDDPLTGQQVPTADVLAFIEEPSRFDGQQLRWLSRPHFVLLLMFLQRLGHVRAQINEFTRRHLEHYYESVLHMQRKAAEPDRVAVLVRLAPGVREHKLEAGTLLDAGKDAGGKRVSYALEHDVYVNRAVVEQLRSVFVERRVTELADLRNGKLDKPQKLLRMFELALGSPEPGDLVPKYGQVELGVPLFSDIERVLAFANPEPTKAPAPMPAGLYLAFHELRELTTLLARRERAEDWPEIYTRLDLPIPQPIRTTVDPSFDAVLAQGLGHTPNYNQLPLVENVDDLYDRRFDADVRAFIVDATKFGMTLPNFEAMMQAKRRIDGQWRQINRLLERAGRRKRRVLSYTLAPKQPTNFEVNLAAALGAAPPWPAAGAGWPPLPGGLKGIRAYQARIDSLEAHLHIPASQLLRVASFAKSDLSAEAGWLELETTLVAAHRERNRDLRITKLELELVASQAEGAAALDHLVIHVLREDEPPEGETVELTPDSLYAKLIPYTSKAQVDLLLRFRQDLVNQVPAPLFGWPDAHRVLELAQRNREGLIDEPPRKVEWRNVHAFEDARSVLANADGSRWKTFGTVPSPQSDKAPLPRLIGLGLCSPLLLLSQGTRTIELLLAFALDGVPRPPNDQPEALAAYEQTVAQARSRLIGAIQADMIAELTTADGWVQLSGLTASQPQLDYVHDGQSRPTIKITLTAQATDPAIAPITPAKDERGDAWPSLRLMLRQRWDEHQKSFTTNYAPFEAINLVAGQINVDVKNLGDLQVQAESSRLDANKPFEPFGSRPLQGSRFYVAHPELVCKRLSSLSFAVSWAGLPENDQGQPAASALTKHYLNYPHLTAPADFKLSIDQVDDGLPRQLASGVAMFATNTSQTLPCGAKVAEQRSRWLEPHVPRSDLRKWRRSFCWSLERDFGHGGYAKLLGDKSRAMAKALAANPNADISSYIVNPPYTPTVLSLRADYAASETLVFDAPAAHAEPAVDRLFHVLPFGSHTLNPGPSADEPELEPPMLPRYDSAGELYIGLAQVDAPQRLSLLVQLAEGTSDPDVAPAAIEWSELSNDVWRPLQEGRIRRDTTRGLINSGIVEIDLQPIQPSTQLPSGLHWLRVAVPREASTRSVCDAVDLHTQAGTAIFVDQTNDPSHYEQPLAPGTIKRLRRPNGKIAGIAQPYSSSGGKPSERPEQFYTRVSERLRHKQRALSPWDYEHLVLERFPELYKVKCLPATLAGREPGLVELVVVPDVRARLPADPFGPKASAKLLADIHDSLRELCPAQARVRVRNPRYVEVKIRLDVRFGADQDIGYAMRRLNEDLQVYLSPWAYDDVADIVIGGKIYANSIVDFVDHLDYVDYVGRIRLFTSKPDGDFQLHPERDDDYHVATNAPDQVLVSAREHEIFVITQSDYDAEAFAGINYMKIELDFIVG